jgi:crotonobetainyl-CoA:carnitine CoA-transferase CaiB-like acyl-CoA transferase
VTDVGVASTDAAGARRADFLVGLRVLELGDGVAGSAASAALWALGAEVTTVVDPSSVHRRGRPDVERDGRRVSLLALLLDRGKHLRSISSAAELEDLLGGPDPARAVFDVVIFDRVAGAHGPLSSLHALDAYVEFVERQNRSAWLTISAFGLTGERASDLATDLTVAAASGMLASVRDEGTGQPLKIAGYPSLLNTGQAGALAACHAFDLATHDGSVHLDLSAIEATIATGPTLEVGNRLLTTGSPGGARRYGAPASFYRCIDGLIRVSAMEEHQWQGVVAAMGSPAWCIPFDTVEARIAGADEIDEHMAAWAGTITKFEAETLLQSNGVPATAMLSPAELLDSPQLAHRDALEPLQIGEDRHARVVGLPFRIVDGGNDRGSGEIRRRSLRGLRMLEASHVLAAPLAGAVLGALGVEVTKLEDLGRLDMYRRRGPYIDGEAGMERSAYFALVNHSKHNATFEVDTERAALEALLDRSDVVLENLGRKRASALGVSASTVVAAHPDVLGVSSSGFGHDGPRATYRAYAYNLHAACGLGFVTRGEDGEPAEIDFAWADLISAYALATFIAAWTVGPSGNRGVSLDFAMADLIVGHFNEFMAAASLDASSDGLVDRANELAPFAPHGVYPTTDGWIAIAVIADEQFERLAKVLQHEPLAQNGFTSAAARFELRHVLDEHVADATRGCQAEELAAALRAVGVPAEAVLSLDDLLTNAQLAERDFLTPVEHPVWGYRRLVGIPWRPFGGPAIALGAPPLLTPARES